MVGDEDSVQSRSQSRIDVGARAVADHPGAARITAVVAGERKVSLVVFLGKDLNSGKVRCKPRPLQLTGLFGRVSFGDKDEAVPSGQIGERLGYLWEKFDLMFGDTVGEAEDALMLLVGGRAA